MDQHCQQEAAEKSSTPAGLSPLLRKWPPRPPSSHHCPPLIQELAEKGGESKMESHFVEGVLYEIDHLHLPTGTPSQLRFLRVAMVCEEKNLNIGVMFPSMASLREFFNCSERQARPALDEKFVIVKALAARVLVKRVPEVIYAQQKWLKSFWLISSISAEMCRDKGTDEEKKGSCFSKLKENVMVTWGSRWQMKFLGWDKKNDCIDGNAHNSSKNFEYGDAGLWGDKSKERDSEGGKSEEGLMLLATIAARETKKRRQNDSSASADDLEIDEEEEQENKSK